MKRSWTGSSSAKSAQLLASSLASISDPISQKELPSQGSLGPSVFEKKFPFLNYLVNEPAEWEAMFRLLRLAEKIFNTKAISRTDKWKDDLALLVKTYKEWWTILRSHPSLQDSSVRQLSRHLRDFLMIAVEEPMHSVALKGVTLQQKLYVKGKLPIRRIVNRSATPSLRSPSKISTFQVDSGISRFFSVTESLGSGTLQKLSRTGPAPESSGEVLPVASGISTAGRPFAPLQARLEPSFVGIQQAQAFTTESRSEQAYTGVVESIMDEILQKEDKRYQPVQQRRKGAVAPSHVSDRSFRFSNVAPPVVVLDRSEHKLTGQTVGTLSSSTTTYIPLDETEDSGKEVWEPERPVAFPSKPLLDFPRINKSLVADFEEDWRHQRKERVAILKFSSVQEKARCIVNAKQGIGFIRSLGKSGFRTKSCI